MNRFLSWCSSFFKKAAPVIHDVAPLAEQIAVRIDPKLQAAVDKAQEAVNVATAAKTAIEEMRAQKND